MYVRVLFGMDPWMDKKEKGKEKVEEEEEEEEEEPFAVAIFL